MTTIPQGGTVEVVAIDTNDNRLVEVRWRDKKVMMFTIDLRERGEVVAAATGARA
jgi:hypothetical protein